jgi:hypothetical protein
MKVAELFEDFRSDDKISKSLDRSDSPQMSELLKDALADSRSGNNESFDTMEELFADLGI